MRVIAIIECSGCATLKEVELQEGENKVHSCSCGGYFGDAGGTVIVITDKE